MAGLPTVSCATASSNVTDNLQGHSDSGQVFNLSLSKVFNLSLSIAPVSQCTQLLHNSKLYAEGLFAKWKPTKFSPTDVGVDLVKVRFV